MINPYPVVKLPGTIGLAITPVTYYEAVVRWRAGQPMYWVHQDYEVPMFGKYEMQTTVGTNTNAFLGSTGTCPFPESGALGIHRTAQMQAEDVGWQFGRPAYYSEVQALHDNSYVGEWVYLGVGDGMKQKPLLPEIRNHVMRCGYDQAESAWSLYPDARLQYAQAHVRGELGLQIPSDQILLPDLTFLEPVLEAALSTIFVQVESTTGGN